MGGNPMDPFLAPSLAKGAGEGQPVRGRPFLSRKVASGARTFETLVTVVDGRQRQQNPFYSSKFCVGAAEVIAAIVSS
jgi:hypothetical protein